jgi:hypothetical protein
MQLKTALVTSDVVDDPLLQDDLERAFPPSMHERSLPKSTGTSCAGRSWRQSLRTCSSTGAG